MTEEVTDRVIIDMPKKDAWQKLRDLSLAHNYVPGVVGVEMTTELTEGVGASRKVYQGTNKFIEETIEEWKEGAGFLLRLHLGDKPAPPFKRAWFCYLLEDHTDEQTRFTASLIYELPWGGFGRFLDKLMLNRVMQRVISDLAIAMKLYYESGEPTTAEKLKRHKAASRKTPS
jgi:Polyketide cyclase / dehydrase and lipid transport